MGKTLRDVLDEANAQFKKEPGPQQQPAPTTSDNGAPLPQPILPLYGFFVGCGILTAVVWLNMVHQFWSQTPELDSASGLNTLYLMVLGLYGGAKHVTPSIPEEQDTRLIRGSFFVWFWIATCAMMYVMKDNHWHGIERVPHDILTLPGGVFAIFLGSKAAKAYLPKGRGAAFKSVVPAGTAPKPDATDSDDPILSLLEGYPDGLSSAQIASKLSEPASTIRARLHELVAEFMLLKVSSGRTDPLTRYKLTKYR